MKPRVIRPKQVKLDLKGLATYIGPFHGQRFLDAAEAAIAQLRKCRIWPAFTNPTTHASRIFESGRSRDLATI